MYMHVYIGLLTSTRLPNQMPSNIMAWLVVKRKCLYRNMAERGTSASPEDDSISCQMLLVSFSVLRRWRVGEEIPGFLPPPPLPMT